jgi:hypothetical protein
MFISLDSVVEAARRRLAALTPEVAGYVVLLAARRLAARPSRVSPSGILLTDGGDVVCPPDALVPELEVEAGLRGVLQTLLELSPSPVPAISAVALGGSAGSLSGFAQELSAALIPINHAAAQRALARLYRETLRAGGANLESAPARESPGAAAAEPMPVRPVAEVSPAELTAEPPPVAPLAVVDGSNEFHIEVDLDAEPAIDAPLVTPERIPPVEPIAGATPAASEQFSAAPPPVHIPVRLPAPAAPEIAAPEIAAPEIAAPEIAAPEIAAPEIAAPEIAAPEIAAPEIAAAPGNGGTRRPSERRSDVRELLLKYLAEARSDEHKMRKLRAMIGIEDGGGPTSDDEPSAI